VLAFTNNRAEVTRRRYADRESGHWPEGGIRENSVILEKGSAKGGIEC
jgi:hypothetical protein